jgi:uncharacterized protein involved in oxidation of intracellular sulfur
VSRRERALAVVPRFSFSHDPNLGVPMGTSLLILNDPPYGTERSYNALRLAGSLVKSAEEQVRVFLVGDAAACAKRGQQVAEGWYRIERMLHLVAVKGGAVGVCGTCMDARGFADDELTEGARRSSLEELADWTLSSDRILVF